METTMLGSLRVRTVEPRGVSSENHGDKPPLTCVLLHGFGAPGDDLVGLAGALAAPPGTRFVFPEAPNALDDFISGPARAWWMVDLAARERAIARGLPRDLTGRVPDGLTEARAALTSMLDALPKDRRLVLGGFSQGAMLSLDLALRQPARPLAGLILFSGTIIAEEEWRPLYAGRKGTKVFQSHGESDPILQFSIAERLRDELIGAGCGVTFDRFGGAHTIDSSTLRRLGGWLKSL